jgi:steroid delta-isomerase-like uncharacterized protein
MGNLRPAVEQHYRDVKAQDWDGMRKMFASDVRIVMPGAPPMAGIDAFLEFGKTFATALPDAHMELKSTVEEGNTIIAQGLYVGTHNGPLATPNGNVIPPTGKRVELPFADVFEFEDGKVKNHTVYFDQMVLMQQLGLVPEPASA